MPATGKVTAGLAESDGSLPTSRDPDRCEPYNTRFDLEYGIPLPLPLLSLNNLMQGILYNTIRCAEVS